MDGFASDGAAAEFDFAQLSSISGDDTEFEREISGEYLAQARELVTEIAQAIAAGDATALRRAAHTLKGSSRTIGAEGVANVGAEIEGSSGIGRTSNDATSLERLQSALAAVERALDDYFGTDAYRKSA